MRKTIGTTEKVNRICRSMCGPLALIAAFLMFVGECRLAEMYEYMQEAVSAVSQYSSESRRLVEQYNQVANLKSQALSTRRSNVCILFRSADQTLLQNAYPILKERGYTGAVVLTGDTLPGQGGELSLDEYKMLISAGWQTVLGGSGGADLTLPSAAERFEQYISGTIAAMSKLGLVAPTVYYLEAANAADACLHVLSRHGITVVVQGCDADAQANRYLGKWWGGMYFCGSETLQSATSHVQLSIYESALVGGSMIVTTRRVTDIGADDALDCSISKFYQCLDWFYEEHDTYGFSVVSFDRLYSDKYAAYERLLVMTAGYDSPDQYLEAVTQQLSELSRTTSGIVKQIYAPMTEDYTLSDFFRFTSTHEPQQVLELIKQRREGVQLEGRITDIDTGASDDSNN